MLRRFAQKKTQKNPARDFSVVEAALLIVSSKKSSVTYVSHSTMIRHVILIEQKISPPNSHWIISG